MNELNQSSMDIINEARIKLFNKKLSNSDSKQVDK